MHVQGGRASSTTKRIPVLQASCGRAHTIMLEGGETRGVRVCGANNYGQLGLGHQQPSSLMTYVVPLFKQPRFSIVASVAAGADFSMALLHDGRIFSWGNNRAGQLGLGILAANLKPLVKGNDFVAISAVIAGGAMARTEKISAGHRIQWFQSTLPGYQRHTVAQGDCSDESKLGALGVWGLLEEELAAFARLEQQQIQRMHYRKARLERLVQHRHQATAASDQGLQRQVTILENVCLRKCHEAESACQQDIQRMQAEWAAQETELIGSLLEREALALGRAFIITNSALCAAATTWHNADVPCGPVSIVHAEAAADPTAATHAGSSKQEDAKQADAKENDAAHDTDASLDWEGELMVHVVGAEHLPKKDMLGKCNALAVVHFMGFEYKTRVIKRQYHPEWRQLYTYRLHDANTPARFATRDVRSGALVFKESTPPPFPCMCFYLIGLCVYTCVRVIILVPLCVHMCVCVSLSLHFYFLLLRPRSLSLSRACVCTLSLSVCFLALSLSHTLFFSSSSFRYIHTYTIPTYAHVNTCQIYIYVCHLNINAHLYSHMYAFTQTHIHIYIGVYTCT